MTRWLVVGVVVFMMGCDYQTQQAWRNTKQGARCIDGKFYRWRGGAIWTTDGEMCVNIN